MAVLYITYDGLLEPLGYSQVFLYLRGLARSHEITLVSYEKRESWADRTRRDTITKEVGEAGIRWIPLRYHNRPSSLATAYDLALGLLLCGYLTRRHRVRIIHARSYVAAVLAIGLKRLFGVRFIFDMRGFWADERVDSGQWSADSSVFKISKWFERLFFTHADVVVSLTHAGVAAIRAFPYLKGRNTAYAVIPTCADLKQFQPGPLTKRHDSEQGLTLGYVGTVGAWYRFDPVLQVFQILRTICPRSRLLIINRGQHAYIRERIQDHQIEEQLVEIKSVEYTLVPREMSRMDAGIFLAEPSLAQLARAPTRLGEFLGSGIPCLASACLGDVERILESEKVGVVLRSFHNDEMRLAVERLLALAMAPDIRERCRAVAKKYFDLEQGIIAYDRIYSSLLATSYSRDFSNLGSI